MIAASSLSSRREVRQRRISAMISSLRDGAPSHCNKLIGTTGRIGIVSIQL